MIPVRFSEGAIRAGASAFLLLAVAACSGDSTAPAGPPVRVIDLVRDLPRAETRPVAGVFRIAEHTVSGLRYAAIEAPVPSRIIWTVRFPVRATLRTNIAVLPAPGRDLTVTFRVGVSDERLYEPLAQERVAAARTQGEGWVPLAADLSAYAGRKWSVFYRPDSHPWRLVLSADWVDGSGHALWAAPGVDADVRSARAWTRPR